MHCKAIHTYCMWISSKAKQTLITNILYVYTNLLANEHSYINISISFLSIWLLNFITVETVSCLSSTIGGKLVNMNYQ